MRWQVSVAWVVAGAVCVGAFALVAGVAASDPASEGCVQRRAIVAGLAADGAGAEFSSEDAARQARPVVEIGGSHAAEPAPTCDPTAVGTAPLESTPTAPAEPTPTSGVAATPTTVGEDLFAITVENGATSSTVMAEVASTPAERAKGLMFRESLNDNRGMLFVFPHETHAGFWMKDTLIALDIAFVGADGTVLEVRQGTPLSLEILTPAQPYLYALEVRQGWFDTNGLGPGSVVHLPPNLPAAR